MRFTIFIFLIIIGVYVIIVANSIGKPLVADEWMNRSAAESVVLSGKPLLFGKDKGLLLGHPPLYLYIVGFFFKLFGIGDIQARFIGIVFFVLNLTLIYLLCKNLYPKDRFAPVIAWLFCALSPLAIQGSLMIDIDQTLLTFSATLFLYCFLRFDNWPIRKRILILGLFFFLVICSKFSLPPALLLCIIVYYSLKREFIKAALETLGIAFIGVGLFLLCWWIYCRSLNLMDYYFNPFIYIFHSFFSLQIKGGLLQKLIFAGRDAFRISLWTTPFLLLLYFYVFVKQSRAIIKERIVPRDFILTIFVFIIFFGFLFEGGVSYGFPKSQFPMVPALAVLIAGNVSLAFCSKKDFAKLAIIFVLICLFFLGFIGDTIYLIYYSLKEAFIYNRGLGILKFGLPFLLYGISPILALGFISIFFYSWRFVNKIIVTFVLTILAANLFLDILQAKADYITTAEYGGRGKAQLINFLKETLTQDDTIFSTAEIIYDVRSTKTIFPTSHVWNEPDAFFRFVKENEPTVIVYGISLHTIEQFKNVFLNPQVLEFLEKEYKRKDIGSYTVWIK